VAGAITLQPDDVSQLPYTVQVCRLLLATSVEVISIVCIVQMSTVTHGGRYGWTAVAATVPHDVVRHIHPWQPTSRMRATTPGAYESSLTCEIAFADKAPRSARKGMGILAWESSDSVALLGSGRDSK
jgi:hypothetical protein